MNVLVFLGSGVSYKSGMPSVDTLTQQVVSGEWHSHTDMVFYPGTKDEFVSRLQAFLVILKENSDRYFLDRWSKKDEANYEDLYYLCSQIYDYELGEILNPAIWPYVQALRDDTAHLCVPLPPTGRPITLTDLASRACDYIKCVVWFSISKDIEPLGLSFISDLVKAAWIDSVDIVTLNHDTLIETHLRQNEVRYCDGFGDIDGEVRFFDANLLSIREKKVRLLKLHGSVDWFYLREVSNGMNIDRYGIPVHSDVWHLKSSSGELLSWLGRTPIILCGSYNKLMDYNFGIFADLQYQFYQSLANQDVMVMSGYGWNDRGINGRIFEWLSSSASKRLFLLDEHPEDIKEKSMSAMWHRFNEEVKLGRLIPVRKYLMDSSLNDLELS